MRYKVLDGLRGLAALTVVISHFSNETGVFGTLWGGGAGNLGVMLFFALSGFLMGALYLDEPCTGANVAVFFRRRFARVAPLYFIVVALSLAATTMFAAPHWLYPVTLQNLAKHLVFWSGEGVLWTIPVEVQFYALFPVIWLVYRLRGDAVWVWLFLAMALIALAGYPEKPALLPHAAFFVLGLAISRHPPAAPLSAAFVAALTMYLLSFPHVQVAAGLATSAQLAAGAVWRPEVFMIVIPALLYASLNARTGDLLLANPPARYLGQISYSLYLLHLPILLALKRWTSLPANTGLYFVAFIAAALTAASASYYLLEAPLRRWLGGPRTA